MARAKPRSPESFCRRKRAALSSSTPTSSLPAWPRSHQKLLHCRLAGHGYVRQIARWQAEGYKVKLLFLRLNSPEEAIARVAQRVRQGGHHVPEDVIRRRFTAGLLNFQQAYAPIVDAWALAARTKTAIVVNHNGMLVQLEPAADVRSPQTHEPQADYGPTPCA